MYRKAFPRCTVDGPVEPVGFGHLGSKGAIPRKCTACRYSMEGSCTRAIEEVAGYLHLDHGPCPVPGATHPVEVPSGVKGGVITVPDKCLGCEHLEMMRLVCNYQRERWGDFPRSLDWGDWQPELPNLGLMSGRRVSDELLRAVCDGNKVAAIKAFMAVNAGAMMHEGMAAYDELSEKAARLAAG